jgi:hypothetical protein
MTRDPKTAPVAGDVVLLDTDTVPATVQRVAPEANAVYLQHAGTIREVHLNFYAQAVTEVIRAMPDPDEPPAGEASDKRKSDKPAAPPDTRHNDAVAAKSKA